MLNSLEIRNFRNLKNLRINSLGGVNLIIGKNNTGKSSILEAIMIYASKGDLNTIYELLDNRGEKYTHSNSSPSEDLTELNIKSLSSLFTNRIITFLPENTISIGSVEKSLFGETISSSDFISLNVVKFQDVLDLEGNITGRKVILNPKDDIDNLEYNIGLERRVDKNYFITTLSRSSRFRTPFQREMANTEKVQFVNTINFDRKINSRLFDSITLTEKENYIIDALKIIEPNIGKIAFTEERPGERVAKVNINGNKDVVPLRSMGDGINRILTIILALVNADNGYLLIDEFENGLHHSVQKKLWEIVFYLSKKLNVQVFATTHSEDCIKGFENVLNSNNNDQSGKLIRLAVKDGIVRQVEFDAKELELATENEIEIR